MSLVTLETMRSYLVFCYHRQSGIVYLQMLVKHTSCEADRLGFEGT